MKHYLANPYGVSVYLITNEVEWNKKNNTSVEGCSGLTVWTDKGIMIYVGDHSLSTMVHECTHAVLYILEYVGIEPLSSNGEPMAYLMDSMFTALSGEFEWL
jgi:hypothetical protein